MRFSHNGSKLLDSKPLMSFFVHAGFMTAFSGLTSGVFLSGLALLMGAGDLVLSYLSIIINICGVLILVFSAFLERFQSRKRLTIGLTVLSRVATLFLVAIPALIPAPARLAVFVPMVVVAFTLQAQTTVVLNQWMLGFIDGKKSGRYISLRQTLIMAMSVVLPLIGGWWIDRTQRSYLGFVLVFGAAALASVCELIALLRTPDGQAYHAPKGRHGLLSTLRIPLGDRRFMGFVAYVVAFYLLLYIADSYTMVYLIKYLALPYQTVTVLYMLISLPQVVLLGVWGRISDRKGHEFVLNASIWLFIGETLFMFFVSPQTWFVFIPIAFLTSSVANAGFSISIFNRRYELMPAENRIAYDNFYTAAVGLGFIVGPMLGGFIKSGVEGSAVMTSVLPFAGIRVLYIVAATGILILQLVNLRVRSKETRPAPVEQV